MRQLNGIQLCVIVLLTPGLLRLYSDMSTRRSIRLTALIPSWGTSLPYSCVLLPLKKSTYLQFVESVNIWGLSTEPHSLSPVS